MAENRKFYDGNTDEVFRELVKISRELAYNPNIDSINKEISFNTPPSLLSYGEGVKISVNEHKGKTAVKVVSSPLVFFNITGEDRAQRNVERIHSELSKSFKIIEI